MSDPLIDAYQQRSDEEVLNYLRSTRTAVTPSAGQSPITAPAKVKPFTVGEATPTAASQPETSTDWQGFGQETYKAARALYIGGKVTRMGALAGINRTLYGLHQFALPDTGSMAENEKERLKGLGNILVGVGGLLFSPIAGGAEAVMTPILERYPWLKDYELATGPTAQALRDVMSGAIPILAPGLGLVVIRPSDALGKPFGQGGTLGKTYGSPEEYGQDASPLTAAEALHNAVATAMTIGFFKAMQPPEKPAPKPAKAGEPAKPEPPPEPTPPEPQNVGGAQPTEIKGGASTLAPTDAGQIGQQKIVMPEVAPEQLDQLRQVALNEAQTGGMPAEGPRAFGINFERLGTEQSVKRVTMAMQELLRTNQEKLARAATGEVSSTGYGAIKQTHAQTIAQARANPFTLDDVMQGRFIRPGDTIELLAARKVALESYRDSVSANFRNQVHLANAGDTAAIADLPTLAGFHQLVNDRTYRLQSAVARAQETGNITTDPTVGPVNSQYLDDFIRNISADMDGRDIARGYTQLEKQHGVTVANQWMRNTFANVGRAGWEYLVYAKLSAPTTWVKKAVSEAITLFDNIGGRKLMEWNHRLFWPDDPMGTAPGEARAIWEGYKSTTADAIRLIRQGKSLEELPGVQSWHRDPALAAKALGIPGGDELMQAMANGDVGAVITSTPGAIIDAGGAGLRIGPNVMAATTKLTQAVAAGGEAKALALRLATQRMQKFEGTPGYADKLAGDRAYILSHLDEFPEVADGFNQAAAMASYTNKLGWASQKFVDWMDAVPGMRVNSIFYKIPVNLSKGASYNFPPTWAISYVYGRLAEKLGWGAGMPELGTGLVVDAAGRPLMGQMGRQWAAGGAAREAALAHLERGIALSAVVGGLWANGKITGPISSDRALLDRAAAAGVRQYTLYPEGQGMGKIGFTGYHLIAPIGITVGAMVETMELINQMPKDGPYWEQGAQILAGTTLAIADTIKHEPFFTGMSDFLDTISQPDAKANSYLTAFVKGLVPTGWQRADHALLDQHIKDIQGPLEALRAAAGLPGVIDKRDVITGDPRLFPPGVGPDMIQPFDWSGEAIWNRLARIPDLAIPFTRTRLTSDELAAELWNNQIKISRFPRVVAGTRAPEEFVRLSPPSAREGVRLEDPWFDRWQVLTTKEVTIGGKTQQEAMTEMLHRPAYQALPVWPDNGDRSAVMNNIVAGYRAKAMDELRKEYDDLDSRMREKEQLQGTNQLPTTNPRSTGTPPGTPGRIGQYLIDTLQP